MEVSAFLFRDPSTDEGTPGLFCVPDRLFACRSLELPWRDNRTDLSCIPCGEYHCEIIQSPDKGAVYQVLDVPGRTDVLIHSGNLAGDTTLGLRAEVRGCIELGRRFGELNGQFAVLQSKDTIRRFMEATGGAPLLLTIQEADW